MGNRGPTRMASVDSAEMSMPWWRIGICIVKYDGGYLMQVKVAQRQVKLVVTW